MELAGANSWMVALGAVVATACVLAAAVATRALARAEGAARSAWSEVAGAFVPPREVAAGAAYRAARVPGEVPTDRPPRVVRAAAWSCFFFAQALVAWVLLALAGVVALVGLCRESDRFACLPLSLPLLAVMAPPLVMAWSRWLVGAALVRREATAAVRARGLAWWAIGLNLIVLGWAALESHRAWDAAGPFVVAFDASRAARAAPLAGVALLALGYIAQAVLLLAAARALERARAATRARELVA